MWGMWWYAGKHRYILYFRVSLACASCSMAAVTTLKYLIFFPPPQILPTTDKSTKSQLFRASLSLVSPPCSSSACLTHTELIIISNENIMFDILMSPAQMFFKPTFGLNSLIYFLEEHIFAGTLFYLNRLN